MNHIRSEQHRRKQLFSLSSISYTNYSSKVSSFAPVVVAPVAAPAVCCC